jgi:hypothetical protein
VRVAAGNAGSEQYRVFEQGSTGFVSMSSVRRSAEQRAAEFCSRKGKEMETLQETASDPPYILGNFPRIEIVFDCVSRNVQAVETPVQEPKYARLLELKKLLDAGVITEEEFKREKTKILGEP